MPPAVPPATRDRRGVTLGSELPEGDIFGYFVVGGVLANGSVGVDIYR